jgi:hypothetical protein
MTYLDICQKAKTLVGLVLCFSQRPELRRLPHIDAGERPFQEPYSPIRGIWKSIIDYLNLHLQSGSTGNGDGVAERASFTEK